jgi:Ca-activated chloride channel family protein
MELEAHEGDRLIILVSDAFSSDLDQGQAELVASELKEAGITVYLISVAEGDIPTEVSDIARTTGGEALVAADSEGLKQVFRHIDRMKPARFKSVGTLPMDHFQPFALAALALAAVHLLGLFAVRYTPW